MSQSSSQVRLIVVAVILAAVLITAVTFLASKPEPAATATAPAAVAAPVAPPAAAPVPAEEENNAIVWHAQPIPGPLATVFQDGAGADVTLASFKGKVMVVNYWATWCAPCVKEMPTLNDLQAQMGGPAFEVIAISQDREGAKVTAPFVAKNEWTKIAYYNEPKARFAKDAKMRGLPTTLILDKSGQELGRLEGTIDWTRADAKEALAKLVASPS